MSRPRHAKRGGAHRAAPAPPQAATPPAPDDERTVPDPPPARKFELPAIPVTWETMTYGLNTEAELRNSHPSDPDFLPGIDNFDPLRDWEHVRWALFDQALDRQAELDQEWIERQAALNQQEIDHEPEIE
jgi:hypothetical protein